VKKSILLLAAMAVLALAGTATAALEPGVYDPGSTGCPIATYAAGVLHLEKNCPTATDAAAGADITGLGGQTFTTATFTLANAAQCQGGSPRFDIVTTVATFFLGCNNVTPTTNANGTLTYVFDAATIAAGGGVSFPTGTITAADVLLDVAGTADVSKIAVNGVTQVPAPTTGGAPTSKNACMKGGWKKFTTPSFKNQGQCVSYVNHHHTSGAPVAATTTAIGAPKTASAAGNTQKAGPDTSKHEEQHGKGKPAKK
jgi:hypothetical protein